MTVQIDWEHPGTGLDDGEESGFLMLHNPEDDVDYASWPFHVTPSQHYMHGDGHVWEWRNPEDDIENITLSPSLLLTWDDPNTFHIFVRNGEIQHCGDCQCGCEK